MSEGKRKVAGQCVFPAGEHVEPWTPSNWGTPESTYMWTHMHARPHTCGHTRMHPQYMPYMGSILYSLTLSVLIRLLVTVTKS